MQYPFSAIFEQEEALRDLKRYGITSQYKKTKNFLLIGLHGKLDFKLRQPKSAGIYSFRINKKYRAFGKIVERKLVVFEINTHQ